jgi:hypothetical protein
VRTSLGCRGLRSGQGSDHWPSGRLPQRSPQPRPIARPEQHLSRCAASAFARRAGFRDSPMRATKPGDGLLVTAARSSSVRSASPTRSILILVTRRRHRPYRRLASSRPVSPTRRRRRRFAEPTHLRDPVRAGVSYETSKIAQRSSGFEPARRLGHIRLMNIGWLTTAAARPLARGRGRPGCRSRRCGRRARSGPSRRPDAPPAWRPARPRR